MSAFQNSIQGLDPHKYMHEDTDTFILNEGHQTVQEKLIFAGPKCVDLLNPYIEFCFKSKDSNNESYLENAGNPEKVCPCGREKANRLDPYIEFCFQAKDSSNESHLENTRNPEKVCPCGGKEARQATPSFIINNQSYSFKETSPNGIENKASHTSGESLELTEKNQQETLQLMKSTEELARRMLGECVEAGKKIRFQAEKEFCVRNPYLEFILKSEDSNSALHVTGNCEELSTSSFASDRERRTDEKAKRRNKNSVDIFGKCLTSKDRNKLKVICPHCMKKVSAPGFIRHLSYCMRVSVRKSTRRS